MSNHVIGDMKKVLNFFLGLARAGEFKMNINAVFVLPNGISEPATAQHLGILKFGIALGQNRLDFLDEAIDGGRRRFRRNDKQAFVCGFFFCLCHNASLKIFTPDFASEGGIAGKRKVPL